MPQIPTRHKAGMPSACLWKAAFWILYNPLAIDMLMLAATACLFGLEAFR
jgi:hypothetical protein